MSTDTFKTDSGIPVKRVYSKKIASGNIDNEEPGRFPYTRGLYPNMYRERLWTMRQYSGFGSAEETNKRFKFLLEHGQTGLSLAFDLPTQTGRDSDDPQSEGEIGRTGVSITSIKDMMTCFNSIPLDRVSTSMTINSTASTLLSLYITVAENQGVSPDQLRGTTQNDILQEYIARNTYIYPPKPSMRLIGDMIEYCSKKVPQWYPISISGYHMREAGCNAVQELAFTFANAIEYINTCTSRGLNVDDFAPRLSFFFCCTMEFCEEIAKFRAARRIYAKIMKEKFHATNPKSQHLRFHVQTSGESLTAQQVDNNIVRVAMEALAAVLGGCQSLHTNSRDEALALPTEESVKIEEEVNKYLKKIEVMGGALVAVEKGFFQEEIRNNAYQLKKEIDENKRIIVGVNKYQDEHDVEPKINRIDPLLEQKQLANVKEFKSNRDKLKVDQALSQLQKAAEKDDNNLMPHIINAVKSYSTLGEISSTLQTVFGRYEPKISF